MGSCPPTTGSYRRTTRRRTLPVAAAGGFSVTSLALSVATAAASREDSRLSRLSEALAGQRFVVTSELNPPKGTDLAPLLERASCLADSVDAINVTDSHGARMTLSPVVAGRALLEHGVEPIIQFTSRDRNRIALQSDLLGAAALGLENVVVMGGDPPANGDHPQAKPVFDVFAAELLAAITALAEGRDMAGNTLLGPPPKLFAGAVVNPGAEDLDSEIERMASKVEAGAAFFQTQAVYDVSAFERFARRVEDLRVPVLAGIILLKSAKMARWMNDRVPGVNVPESLITRIGSAAEPRAVCVDIAAETVAALRGCCRGVHLMALGWEDLVPMVVKRMGER